MKVVVTGAGGFVGRALAGSLEADDSISLVLVDTAFPQHKTGSNDRVTYIRGQLQDAEVRSRALEQGVDVLFHLAALPGGAAEADPALSKLVNLDATLALFEEVSRAADCPRVVFTSTIAVLGAPLPSPVDDQCRISPAMVYGTHKAMVELALADMTRRGSLDSVGVRLPGIVARPPGPSGLKSAFMSNVFHALKGGEQFVSPVSPAATMWLMSVNQCVANLVHASRLDSDLMPISRVVTLPALCCSMGELVNSIATHTGASPALVSYAVDSDLEQNFGAYPPLLSPAAERAGFAHDEDLDQLTRTVLASLDI